MKLRILAGFVMSTLIVGVARTASTQDYAGGPLEVSHPVLIASVERLSVRSASWREALAEVSLTGRRTILTTPGKTDHEFDIDKLAQALPLVDRHQRVGAVVVIINLELMQRLSGLPVRAAQFEDDLDRILAHEVFGHAIPLLQAGNLAGNCDDPAPGQRATDACAIKRENLIRKELRLGMRFDYGRDGLSMTRRARQ